MKRRGVLIATVAASLFSCFFASEAVANESRESVSEVVPDSSARCIQEAKAKDLKSWACLGSTLLAEGSDRGAEEARPVVDESAVVAGGASISPTVPPKTQSGASALADDYDWYCEATGVCTRRISNYISETKANIYYGYGGTTVGNFDAILRTNLNGRQAQSRLSLIWDGGPQLYFEYANLNCFEEIEFFPDLNCGIHAAGTGIFIGPAGSYRWNSSTVYGNYLSNSNEYYTTISARFRPTGYDTLTFSYLFQSPLFRCYGSDNCYFP